MEERETKETIKEINRMSSKTAIIGQVRDKLSKIKQRYEMPDIRIEGIRYADPVEQFAETCRSVGGKVHVCAPEEDLETVIKSYFPDAQNSCSQLPEIGFARIRPDEAARPGDLADVDLAIVKGELGVAENACVWVPRQTKHRSVYFIAEQLVILLNTADIVHNMHEAYERIPAEEYDFGCFISGPSKTADIEQSLVIGAHGAKGVLVVLRT